jgi:DNA-binding IclR family transcriptional regulator
MQRAKGRAGGPIDRTAHTRNAGTRIAKAIANENAGASGAVIRSVPAVRRAAMILWLLAESGSPMSLSQIAREINIFPSTCLHILRELIASRLIQYDQESKAYSLGQGIVELAQTVIHYDNFAELCRPHLLSIANRFAVTAMANSEVDQQHVACVAVAKPINSASLNVILGGKVPLYAGATGRCVAAHEVKSRAQMFRHFSKIRWQSPLTFDEWCDQIIRARDDGFGEDEGYFTKGVTTLAVPVPSPDGLVSRTLGVIAISAQLDPPLKQEIIGALKTAAAEITSRIGS